jgi:hypothetical protein
MTMPHSPGWYDDPDDPAAERYFNGQDWTPQRKRKPSTPSRPPQPDPYAPVPPAGPVDPYASGYPYPAGPADPHASGYPYPAGPPDPHASAYAYPAAPADPFGSAPPAGPAGPHGSFAPAGSAPQAPLSRLRAGMAVGVDRIVGLVISGAGVLLIVASVSVWGRATLPVHDSDGTGSVTASFPGVGEPSITGHFSNGSLGGTVTMDTLPPTLHNTNPGWITLALGAIAIIAGIAYLWLRQRGVLAIAVASLAAISAVLCVAHMFDVGGTFNNPPDLAGVRFAPGTGLVAACVLSFALAAVGITASVFQWRAQYKNSAY